MQKIRQAIFPDDAAGVLDIWREYVDSPNTSLSYQNYEAEFTNIPGKYASPAGAILIAEERSIIIGCIAMRRVTLDICEMKRLYVRPSGRGQNLGRKLVKQLILQALQSGYREMRLDVLAEFKHAQALYASMGFTAAEPISHNPVEGTRFLGLIL